MCKLTHRIREISLFLFLSLSSSACTPTHVQQSSLPSIRPRSILAVALYTHTYQLHTNVVCAVTAREVYIWYMVPVACKSPTPVRVGCAAAGTLSLRPLSPLCVHVRVQDRIAMRVCVHTLSSVECALGFRVRDHQQNARCCSTQHTHLYPETNIPNAQYQMLNISLPERPTLRPRCSQPPHTHTCIHRHRHIYLHSILVVCRRQRAHGCRQLHRLTRMRLFTRRPCIFFKWFTTKRIHV